MIFKSKKKKEVITTKDNVKDLENILNSEENLKIREILSKNIIPDTIKKEEFEKNIVDIQKISADIKEKSRDSLLAIGERLCVVRDILKSYKKGAWTAWAKLVIKNEDKARRLINYYKFYNLLDNWELKEKFKKMPFQAAATLAIRPSMNLEKKIDFVEKYYNSKNRVIQNVLTNQFPTKNSITMLKFCDKSTQVTLRFDRELLKEIDKRRSSRAGWISRNTWITEAIVMRIKKENAQMKFKE